MKLRDYFTCLLFGGHSWRERYSNDERVCARCGRRRKGRKTKEAQRGQQ